MKNSADLYNDGWQTGVSIEEDCEPPKPTDKKVYARAKLTNVREVGREIAKLYREARSGRIDVADASRLGNLLSILARVLTDSELEARIESLEKRK